MFWKENHFGIPFNTWLFDRYSHTAPYTTTKDLSRTIVSTQIRLDTFFPWLFIFWKTDHFGSFIAIVTQHHGTPHRIPFVIFSPSTVHHMFMLACQLHSTLLVSSAAKLYHLFFWKKKKKTNFKMQSPLLLEEVLKKRREKEKSRKKNFFNIPPQCFTALQAKMHARAGGTTTTTTRALRAYLLQGKNIIFNAYTAFVTNRVKATSCKSIQVWQQPMPHLPPGLHWSIKLGHAVYQVPVTLPGSAKCSVKSNQSIKEKQEKKQRATPPGRWLLSRCYRSIT